MDGFCYLFNGSFQSNPLQGRQTTDIRRFSGGALTRDSSATLSQWQGACGQLDLNAQWRLDRETSLRLTATNVTRETRGAGVSEFDTSGQVVREEEDRERGLTGVFLALQTKW